MCQYKSLLGWECPFEPEPGKKLCIFHLPLDQKEPKEFYKHLANYLLALYEKNQTPESKKFLEEKKPWIGRERDDKLLDHYLRFVTPGEVWDFTGFVFPAMDKPHNFSGFNFPVSTAFREAKFQNADFRWAEFHQNADFIGTEFQNANFVRAEFQDADFSRAKFRNADFSWTEFQNANFSEAEFQNTNFSFAHFKNPPSFRGAEFKEKVDFYEAKIPGLSKDDDERTARYIRLQAEKYGSYADAGDFYIIEMDFRRKRFRKDPKRWFQYILMELYRLVSRYGESPGRGAISLVLALLFFSGIFVISGFNFMNQRVDRDLFPPEISALGPTLKDIGLAFLFALANIIPGNIGGDVMGNELSSATTKVWVIAQVIITYIILALFLLAIRRRFSR